MSSGSFEATYCLHLHGKRLSFYLLLLLFFDALFSFSGHKTAGRIDFFLCVFRIVEGGLQLGPLGTSATNCPVEPALGDYEDREFDGMMIGRGNRNTRRKPIPVPLCPSQIPHDLTGTEPGPPRLEASS
jgi:hypothetical protein